MTGKSDAELTELSKQAHLKSDVDSGARAQHHTLGDGPLQAASGADLVALRKALAALTPSALFLASHPVGSVFMTDQPGNPGPTYGGTWVAYGAGRVPVGIDATQAEFDTVNETGGAKTVTLVKANLPTHVHTTPDHNHPIDIGNTVGASTQVIAKATSTVTNAGGIGFYNPSLSGAGVSGNGAADGLAATAVDKLQPYIVCYMWKRTA